MAYTHDSRDITSNAMTGYVSGGYTVSACASDYPAWYAFDHKCAADLQNWLASASTIPNCWIKIDLGSGNAKKIVSYSVTGWFVTTYAYGPSHPKDWKLYGSNDDSTWYELHSVTGAPAWSEFEMRYYDTTNYRTTAFRYLKLVISAQQSTSGNGVNYVCVGELEFYETTGWSHTISGVSSPAYVCGVAGSAISKVMGV